MRGTRSGDRDDSHRGHNSFHHWARPNCNRCSHPLEAEAVRAAFYQWLETTEPVMTCPACGWSALLGDWPAPWSFVVGAPAVVFQNWPPLEPQLVSEIRQVLGGRTRTLGVYLDLDRASR